MEEAYIEQAKLMSSLSKFPVELNDRWAAWNETVVTKKMVLGFLTKLHHGPVPSHMLELLLADYKANCTELPEKFVDLPRGTGRYWNFHKREMVEREYPETSNEWFNRLYFNVYNSMVTVNNDQLKVVVLDNDYKKQVIERIFLSE